MKNIKYFLSIVLVLLFNTAFSDVVNDNIEKIRYITEDYPPYNFQGSDKIASGIAVDLLVEMFKEMKLNKTNKDIEVMPWVHGYNLSLAKGNPIVLFTAIRSPNREKLFKWVGPVMENTHLSMVSLQEVADTFKINVLDDLKKYKFIVLREDISEHFLLNHGVPVENLVKAVTFEQLMDKMYQYKNYATIYDELTFKWNAKKYNVGRQYKVIAVVDKTENYFMFNQSISDDIVLRHQKALEAVKANKKLVEAIYDKYLKD